jgi:hypothetical protein
MRTIFAVIVCLLSQFMAQAQSLAGGDLEFPYEAFVLREGAPVRSGPGLVHYATDNLAQGTTVEVHRHDPGGWCAIRPPGGSFSLIPESAVELVDDNVGRINSGSTQAWVGTRLGVVESPLWQVKLKEDELVEILGEVSWPNPEGHSNVWYQIAPPAGEFRWIQISDLQLPDDATRLDRLTPATSNIADHDPNANDAPSPAPVINANRLIAAPSRHGWETDAPAMAPALIPPNLNAMSSTDYGSNSSSDSVVSQTTLQDPQDSIPDSPIKSINRGWRRSKSPIERDSAIGKHASTQPPNQFTAPSIPGPIRSFPIESGQQAGPPLELQSVVEPASASLPNQPPPERYASNSDDWGIAPQGSTETVATTYVSGAPASPGLQQLELALTNEMLKQPPDWQLNDLLLQTEQFIDSAQNPADTQQANRLLEKIKRCQKIRSSYRTAYNDDSTSNMGSEKSLRGPIGTGIEPDVELGTLYDASGWLNELVSGKGSVNSSYVLQDDDGKITHHVLPAPGVNLHLYLGSKVGIIGQRGFNQRLNLAHVTAQRVVELRKAD